MTGKRESGPGRRDKIVHKVLADGTVREYRYSRERLSRKRPLREHGAIRALAELYVKSPEFRALSATWQSAKRYYLGLLEDRAGWMTMADLASREIRGDFYEIRDAFAGKPHKADKLMDTLKGLLAWAYERGQLEVNHALGIKRLASSKGTRSENVWTEDQEAVVLAAFPASLSQAWRLALYTAARQTDLCGLRWDQLRDGWLSFRPSKTKGTSAVQVHLPVFALPPLEALLGELSRGTEYLLTTEEGQPWKAENLRARWRAAMGRTDLAGADLHWHDIRGTALSRMAEAGCTDAERAAISGHSLGGGKLADYTARSKQLALNAYAKWARYIAQGPEVVSLETIAGNRRR
jgi:integrase